MRARLSTSVFVCAAAALLAAQTTPPAREVPQSTFRAASNYVRVDMYASRDGRPIEDLTADDVEVLEDGAPQKLDAFEHVKVRAASPQDVRVDPDGLRESREAVADPRARVFVVFLDTYHTSIDGSANVRVPIVRFIDSVVGPDDLIAVMTPEMSVGELTFGRKTTVVSNMMQNDRFWGRRGRIGGDDPKEELYRTCYPPESGKGSFESAVASEMKERRREKLALDALDDLTTHLNGVREERKAVLVVSEGWRLFPPNNALANAGRDKGRDAGLLPDPFNRPRRGTGNTDAASGNMRAECEADRVALSMIDNRNRLREISDAANRGNVSFYTVYPRGLVASDTPIDSTTRTTVREDMGALSARQDSLRFLAENTDAVSVINTNNIEGAFRRIVSDLSSYYLLGYYSSNTRLDGKFRSITVRVKRPGTQVRARRGYRGPTAEAVLSAAERPDSQPSATMTAALATVAGASVRAPFRIRTASWRGGDDGDSATLWVIGELDYTTRRDVAWTGGAHADITVVSGDGQEVATEKASVPAADGSFAVRVAQGRGLKPGDYAIRVRLQAEVDPSATLSDTTRAVVAARAPTLGEAIVARRGPSTGLRYLNTADPRFRRTERLRLELPTRAEGVATARMLDRTGKPLQLPVQISERKDASGEFRWVVADASLAPLAAGEYAVEVTLGDAKQVTAFSLVP